MVQLVLVAVQSESISAKWTGLTSLTGWKLSLEFIFMFVPGSVPPMSLWEYYMFHGEPCKQVTSSGLTR